MSSFLERINLHQVGKILTIALYPAGILGMSVFAYDVGLFHIFPYRILIPLIWLIFIFLLFKRRGGLDLRSSKVRLFGLFLLIWLIYAFLSITWAIDKYSALRHVILLFLSISVIYFSVMYLDNPDVLYLISIIWLVILGMTIILGITEAIFGIHLPTSRYYLIEMERVRYMPTGVFYNPNDFATFLSLSAPYLLSFFIFSKRTLYRVILFIIFIGLIYVMIHTKSRANLLALFSVIIFFVILSLCSRKFRVELAIFLSGTFLLLIIFRERIIDEFGSIIAAFQALPTQIVNPTGSIGVRVNLIRNGAYFLNVTRGFGVAAGNFENWMRTRAIFPTLNKVNAHNWFLEVIVNYGVFIFVGYLVFYLGLIVQMFRVLLSHWNDQKMRIVGVAIMGAMIAFSFASTSSSSLIAFRPQWLMFALGLAYVRVGLSNDQIQTEITG